MITNERQYRITKAEAEKFRQALARLASDQSDRRDIHPRLIQAEREGIESQLEDLERELMEYEALKAGRAMADNKHEHEQDSEGRQICTTSGEAPSKVRAEQTEKTGQHKSYIVLCEEERAKGFVRPYRDAYKHVGRSVGAASADQCPQCASGPLRIRQALIDETKRQCTDCGHVWQPETRVGGCGTVTTMGRALSETYARDPKFYSHTFCVRCNRHLPVAEFVWTADGETVGS